jgi:hypothetical protein
MASDYTCPECGETARKREHGEFALIGITDGRIQLHTDKPETPVLAVRAEICVGCSRVTLYEVL